MSFFERLKGQKSFLGLDIGTYSLKLAEATLKGSQIVITGFGQIRLPKEVVVDGLVQKDEIFLKHTQTLLENLRPKSRNLNFSLYAYNALFERTPISLSEGSDLSSIVKEEIESFIPFGINDVYYDYYPLIKEDKYEIIFAVCKKEYVDKFLELFSKIGLNLNVIDVDVFSISNLLEYLYNPLSRMIIDIGASKTLVVFMDKYGPLFSREISYGLSNVTTNISRELDVSFEEAENLKLKIPDDDRGYVIKEIYTEFFRSLLEELQNSLDIFKAKYYSHPEEIFLIGGGAFVPGISEFIQKNLKLPVKDLDLSSKIAFSKDFDKNYISELNKVGVLAISQAIREFIA